MSNLRISLLRYGFLQGFHSFEPTHSLAMKYLRVEAMAWFQRMNTVRDYALSLHILG